MMKLISHMQLVICKSLDYDITIAFSLKYELRQTCRCRHKYESSLVKNLPNCWKNGEENWKTNKNILAP